MLNPRNAGRVRKSRRDTLRLEIWIAMLWAAALSAGCAGTPFSSAGGPGGLSSTQAAEVSLIVAQTRSQFPQLSAQGIPYQTRKPPEEGKGLATLVLRGRGMSVRPGLQLSEPKQIEVALHLDKATRSSGFLEVTLAGEALQRWSIAAFDQRGSADKVFDFMYVLVTPDGAVRHFVLLGGPYEAEGAEWVGYEGTLIVPGPGGDPAKWERAYKLDFGFRFPLRPEHQGLVEQAVEEFREIDRAVAQLDRLRQQLAAAEAQLATLRSTQPSQEQAASHDAKLADAEARVETLNVERGALLKSTEAAMLRYYELRRSISESYAVFAESNRYLWASRSAQQAFHDAWKVVEFHHPRIDDLVSIYLTHTDDTEAVLTARSAAMAVIARNDNWAKDPSGTAQSRRSGAPAP